MPEIDAAAPLPEGPASPRPQARARSPAGLPAQAPRRPSTPRTVMALVLREMATTYGNSALGYLWAILEPVAGIMLLTLLFALAFRAPPVGTNFPLFFASGVLPFMAYMTMSQVVSTATRFSRPLLAYPGVTYLDAIVARLVLNAMTQVLIFVVVIGAILVLYDIDVILDPGSVALGLFMAVSLGSGIGVLNCYLLTSYPVWERAWAILTRPLFFISGVIFTFQSVPLPYRDWLWWNPLVHVIGETRAGIYATYDDSYVSLTYVLLVSFVPMAAGLVLLRRHHRDMMNM